MGARGIPGVILAGGRALRMGGGDKPLRTLAGRPLVSHMIERLRPQCAALAINANGDPARYAAFGVPVVPDGVPDPGPLGGVLAAMDWASAAFGEDAVVLTVPGDCPFLPPDLVERLEAARLAEDADVASAVSADRRHPLTAVWRVNLRAGLRRAVVDEGMRRVGDWAGRNRTASVTWPAWPLDPFFNANTHEDLAEAERLLATTGS